MPQLLPPQAQILGCLLGTAVGDALGLPYEGLSPQRAARFWGPPTRYRFWGQQGWVSDDTEHACMTAEAFVSSDGDVAVFQTDLSWRMRRWLCGLPAGIGLATLKSILKLWVGVPPSRSGIFSAGNGPAMRAPVLGVICEDLNQLRELIRVSTRMTHSDPKAEHGALALALAAWVASRETSDLTAKFHRLLLQKLPDAGNEFWELIEKTLDSVKRQQSTRDFAHTLGLERGVTGYIYHTLPIVVHTWLSHPQEYELAIQEVIACGGDADTTAAILGGIVGASVGKQGIPADWVSHLQLWPRSVEWMAQLSAQVAEAVPAQQSWGEWMRLSLGQFARNLLFLLIVLGQGFRRLLPPY